MVTNPVRSEATCLPAGRYEFKDAGIYIGEWLNEKAVGLGLITKDKCQGEYTGLWDAGMEKSGVFLWPNAPGAMYEGEWANNRRNGFGIFTREDWVIKGKFKDDFIAIGVKCKENSIGRFEGEFENGFPSFGVETYADGGNYSGEYKTGIREGLGVRTSIPYGEIINFFPEEAALAAEMALKVKARTAPPPSGPPGFVSVTDTGRLERRGSLLSQRSGDVADFENTDLAAEEEPYHGRLPTPGPTASGNKSRELRMSTKFRCGFVLSAQRSDLMLRRQHKLAGVGRKSRERQTRARSLSNLFSRSSSKESVRMKRQGSANERSLNKVDSMVDSIFTLDQEDAIDPETIETYAGQWEADCRHGYGVCERTDGVSYEGQWFKNQRHGYGQTRFQDGSLEQGRYQWGKLVFLSWPKGSKPHLLLYNYHIRIEVSNAVKRAKVIAEQARLRSSEAKENLDNVFTAVEQAQRAAEMARDYSLETRELVKEMYPDFEQPGIKYLDDMVRLMHVNKSGNQTFEAALQAAQEVLAAVAAGANSTEAKGDLGSGHLINHQSPGGSPVKGSPISRAGSYRMRRQSRRRTQRLRRKESESGHLLPGEDQFGDHFDYDRKNVHPSKSPLTLVVPQMSNHVTKSFDDSIEQQQQPKRPTRHRTIPSHNYLRVPQDSSEWIIGEDELGDWEVQTDGRRVSRSPSVSTTYVTIPGLSDLRPESEIPRVPIDKIMNNTNWMNDHFNHYAVPKRPTPGPTDPVTNRSRDRPSPQGHDRQLEATASGLSSGRRRTVPVILTQRPVTPEKRLGMDEHKVDKMRELPEGDVEMRNSDFNLPDIVISSSPAPECFRSESIYLVDDGVRKKLSAEEKRDQPETVVEHAPQLALVEHDDKRLAIPMGKDVLRPTENQTPPSIPTVRPIKPLPVVANVLLETVQDEIPELSIQFKESRLEPGSINTRCSVPDVGTHLVNKSPGLSPEELSVLSAEWQDRHARELARRNQGELVIHLTDLWDWFNRNVTPIIFILLNGLFAYLFANLLTDSRTRDR